MARTDKKVRYSLKSKLSEIPGENELLQTAARTVEVPFRMLEGRWKLLIVFHLFSSPVMRFSDLERAIPAVTQKMLVQQLRNLETDGIVARRVYPQVPPKVEYSLTEWGEQLCGPIEALTDWAGKQPPNG